MNILRAYLLVVGVLGELITALLVLPNWYFWQLYHRPMSMVAMIVVGSCGAALAGFLAVMWRQTGDGHPSSDHR